MLDVDNATAYLLERGLIDVTSILDGDLSIRSAARRNRNLRVRVCGPEGYLLKQPGDPAFGGRETLSNEAAFYDFCEREAAAAPVRPLIPRMAHLDPAVPLFALELIPGAVPLWQYYASSAPQGELPREPGAALGAALGIIHRTFRPLAEGGAAGLGGLCRSEPWVLLAHKPRPEVLATITPANYQTLKILQTQEHLSERLGRLRKGWRVETVIHCDIKSDNVLVVPASAGLPAVDVRVVDWETVQLGDPAWDVAGVLQDFVMFWVFSIPVSPGMTPAEMAAVARHPLADIRPAITAAWHGYVAAAGVPAPERGELLLRATGYSAARLIQSAFELSQMGPALTPQAVLLLQVSANILGDPEAGSVQLYGILDGCGQCHA